MNNLFKEGTRKLTLVYVFGFLGCALYVISAKTIAELTATFGYLVALIGWYNQSNIREHQINNGDNQK